MESQSGTKLSFLKILGGAWGILSFVLAAVFFLGGEWNQWGEVKNRVLKGAIVPPPPMEDKLSGNFKSKIIETRAYSVGNHDTIQLGKHVACLLGGMTDENNALGGGAECKIEEVDNNWSIFVRGALCQAICID